MKKSLTLFVIVGILGVSVFLTIRFLVPFVYRIKEPFFIMPIEHKTELENVKDLPVRNDDFGDGEFGAKRRGGRVHRGLDLAAPLKSPVFASKSGRARARYISTGYGHLVIIDHPGGWQTRYGHLHESYITKSAWVRQGDIIGTVGKSGNAGNRGMITHLHFEIREEGGPLDPAEELLKKRRKR